MPRTLIARRSAAETNTARSTPFSSLLTCSDTTRQDGGLTGGHRRAGGVRAGASVVTDRSNSWQERIRRRRGASRHAHGRQRRNRSPRRESHVLAGCAQHVIRGRHNPIPRPVGVTEWVAAQRGSRRVMPGSSPPDTSRAYQCGDTPGREAAGTSSSTTGVASKPGRQCKPPRTVES